LSSEICDVVVVKEAETIIVIDDCDDPLRLVIEEEIIRVVFFDQIVINNLGVSEEAKSIVNKFEVGPTTVNVNRVVVLRSDGKIEHADKDTTVDANDIFGVSRQSGPTGQLIDIVEFGKLTGAAIGSIGDNFFLGNNGLLISTAPTSGIWMFIGTQTAASELTINLGEPILT